MRKRIYLAIAVVKEASSAISAMPILILYPTLPVIGFVLYLIPWTIFMLYLASSGDIVTDCMCLGRGQFNTKTSADIEDILNNAEDNALENYGCGDGCFVYRNFIYEKNTQYAGLYLVFSLFWTSQFITAWLVKL